jgi:molecular chaperone DnaK
MDKYKEESGIDLRGDKIAMQRIKEASEVAKMQLSSTTKTEINLPYITVTSEGPQHLVTEMTQKELNGLIKSFIQRTIEPCKQSLKDAQMTTSDIDTVILVGGSTRIPLVQDLVKDFYGQAPSKGVNPDEAVALGAAIQSGIMEGGFEGIVLIDVVPLSLGTEVVGGIFSKIIERNQAIPCSNTQRYVTVDDNQTSIQFRVYQGEREMAADNKYLGEFTLGGLAPAPRGVAQVDATMAIDNNGILNVTAKDVATGKSSSITIQPSGGLSKAEIERMVKEGERSKEEDTKKRELIEAQNGLDQSVHKSQQVLEEFKDKLTEENIQKVQEAIKEAELVLKSAKSAGELNQALKALDSEVMKIGQMVYGQASGSDNDGNNNDGQKKD